MDVSSLVKIKPNARIPDLVPGDTVKVSAKIVESGKERIQVFQGVVIKVRRGGTGASFTVRHVAYGIGVERTFPFNSPLVEKVEIVRHGKVRRAKLYYLRELSGRQARRKVKQAARQKERGGEAPAEGEEVAEEAVMEAGDAEAAVLEGAPEAEAAAPATEEAPAESETEAPEKTGP